MKTFKDLKVADVLYIVRDDGLSYVCKVVKIEDSIVYYDHVDKYTDSKFIWYFFINMETYGEHSCLVCEKSGYTVYLNRELALKDLDERIEFLTRQKKNLWQKKNL